MAIVPMKRLEIAASRSDKFALLQYLQSLGVTDITENEALREVISEHALCPEERALRYAFHEISDFVDLIHLLKQEDGREHLFLHAAPVSWTEDLLQEVLRWQERIVQALKTLRPLDLTKKGLFSHKRPRTLEEQAGTLAKQVELLEIVTRIEQNQAEMRPAEESLAGMRTHLNTLAPLKDIALPEHVATARLRGTSAFFRNEAEYLNLLEAAKVAEAALAGEIYYRGETQVIALLAWPFSQDEKVRRVMSESVMQSFPAASEAERAGNFRKAYEELDQRIRGTEQRIQDLAASLEGFVPVIPELEELFDIYKSIESLLRAEGRLSETEHIFFLTAYVPAVLEQDVREGLTARFRFSLAFSDPPEGDLDVPTELANAEAVGPIESILTTFSPPNYFADMDPSPIMVITYAFFFGSMLSDIGYGALLVVGCLLGLFHFKAEGNMRKMLWVFLSGGAVAVVFGILYGGFFGNMLPAITDGRISLPVFWFDPMNEPITLMIWSMVFGAVHLFVAIGIDIYNKIRLGEWYDAVFGVAPWYLIIGGIGLLVLGVPFATWIIIGGAAIILLMSSKERNPFKRLISGLLGLYNVTAWLSDLLSYTRILALTLATSVIAMVVNMMAAMIGSGGLKVIFLAAVLLVGHSLNIALSTLSAYVHATRLHYVEFFGRFYTGGGRLFNPLNKQGVYTRVEEPLDLTGQIRTRMRNRTKK